MVEYALSLVARYGHPNGVAPKGELVLGGKASDLRELALLLRTLKKAIAVSIQVPFGHSPEPYDGYLNTLKIELTDNNVNIYYDDSTLFLTGSADMLQVLAENIQSLATSDSEPSEHMHVEYFPEHYYLEAQAVPLVIELQEVDSKS